MGTGSSRSESLVLLVLVNEILRRFTSELASLGDSINWGLASRPQPLDVSIRHGTNHGSASETETMRFLVDLVALSGTM